MATACLTPSVVVVVVAAAPNRHLLPYSAGRRFRDRSRAAEKVASLRASGNGDDGKAGAGQVIRIRALKPTAPTLGVSIYPDFFYDAGMDG